MHTHIQTHTNILNTYTHIHINTVYLPKNIPQCETFEKKYFTVKGLT